MRLLLLHTALRAACGCDACSGPEALSPCAKVAALLGPKEEVIEEWTEADQRIAKLEELRDELISELGSIRDERTARAAQQTKWCTLRLGLDDASAIKLAAAVDAARFAGRDTGRRATIELETECNDPITVSFRPTLSCLVELDVKRFHARIVHSQGADGSITFSGSSE